MVLKRYTFFNEILVWHASGEEDNVFPALEKVAPLVAEAYDETIGVLDNLYIWLDKAVMNSDALAVARATAAFDFHLNIHLNKEEAHLYRIFNERIPLPDQGIIIGNMAQDLPRISFPEVVAWLYPLLGTDDQVNMIRIWQQALPPPMFAKVTNLIKVAIGDGWEEMVRKLPELK